MVVVVLGQWNASVVVVKVVEVKHRKVRGRSCIRAGECRCGCPGGGRSVFRYVCLESGLKCSGVGSTVVLFGLALQRS